jgi:cytochrome P450
MPSGDLADLIDPGLTDLDQFAERVPFDIFDRLRREAPVYWHPEAPPNHGFWAVTRHDDVSRVNHDVKTYSSEVGAVSIEELDDEQLKIHK